MRNIFGNQDDIFISYSHKDVDFAQRLKTALEDEDYSAWMDRGRINGGEPWLEKIVQGIESIPVFIFIVSKDSWQSEICQLELLLARQENCRIIPVLIKEISGRDARTYATELDNNTARKHLKYIDSEKHLYDKYHKIADDNWQYTEAIHHIKFLDSDKNLEEKPFTELCRSLQGIDFNAKRNRLLFLFMVSLAAILFILSGVMFSLYFDARASEQVAQTAATESARQAATAQYASTRSVQQAHIANSQSLALASLDALRDGNTDLAVSLALQANTLDTISEFAQQTLFEMAYAPGARQEPFENINATHISISPHNDRVLLSDDNSLQILDLSTGEISLFLTDYVKGDFIVKDGDELVTAIQLDTNGANELHTYRLPSGVRESQQQIANNFSDFAVSNDGNYIAYIRDVPILQNTNQPLPFRISASPIALAVSNSGVIAAIFQNSQMEIFDTENNTSLIVVPLENYSPVDISISSDAQMAIIGFRENLVGIWRQSTPDKIQYLRGHDFPVTSVSVNHDGSSAVSLDTSGDLRWWQINTGFEQLSIPMDRDCRKILNPDGYQGVCPLDDELIFWRIEDDISNPIFRDSDFVSEVRFSSNGQYLLTRTNSAVMLWNAKRREKLGTIFPHDDELSSVLDMDISADGNTVLVRTRSATHLFRNQAHFCTLQDVENPQILKLNDTGNRLGLVTRQNDVFLYDIDLSGCDDRTKLQREFFSSITFADFGSDDVLIIGSENGRIELISLDDELDSIPLDAHRSSIQHVVLDDNLPFIVSISQGIDTTVRIWSRDNYQLLHTFPVEGQIVSVAAREDNLLFISLNDGRIMRLELPPEDTSRIACDLLNERYIREPDSREQTLYWLGDWHPLESLCDSIVTDS